MTRNKRKRGRRKEIMMRGKKEWEDEIGKGRTKGKREEEKEK